MIKIDKALDFKIGYPLERFCPAKELLFFDIETTGFSGDSSNLYLIGCVYFEDGSWRLRQWFADRADAEEEILREFFEFLTRFTALIHFNGDGFDIPYLLKRCRAYDLPCNFDAVRSVDIYRLIRPYKKLLGLDSLKQKSVECFLGICREDRFSGGELIAVYREYLETRRDSLYRLLILHNEEDLKGMPGILPILLYHDFLNSPFSFTGQELEEITDAFGSVTRRLCLSYESPVAVPVPVEAESSLCRLELKGRRLCLGVELYEGELKRFYEDYQNYYFLVFEDNAVHKSVGEYVEKSARKKATAKTCYTRFQGLFLPVPAPLWEPLLKEDYKSKKLCIPYRPEFFGEGEHANIYLREAVKNWFSRW